MQLDGVRGLAILLVTLYRFGKDMPSGTWLGNVLSSILGSGQRGVELFFVLSGFLITGILIDAKRNDDRYFVNFFARRSLRILPLYFFSLALFLWIIPAVFHLSSFAHPYSAAHERQFYLWTYLTNIHMSATDSWCFGPLDHYWSLAVEEHFYLVWPLFVFALSPQWLLRAALGGAMLAITSRTTWIALGCNETAPMVLTFFRCDGLLLGAALAVVVRDKQKLDWLAMHVGRWWWLLLCGSLLFDLSERRFLMAGCLLWTLAWLGLLSHVISAGPGTRIANVFAKNWLTNLGKYSYGMYVFQNPLIPLMVPLWLAIRLNYGETGTVVGHLTYMVLMFAITYGLAYLSWHVFEKHWLGLKRYFVVKPATKRCEVASLLGGVASSSPATR